MMRNQPLTLRLKLVKRIFTAAVMLFAGAVVSANAQDDARLAATWRVQKYDITATLPSADTDRSMVVKAAVSVTNVSGSPASTLSLRISPNAEVTAVTINGSQADFSKREEKINAGNSLQRLVVRVPAVQPGAAITATVDYKLNIKENSGLAAISPVATHFLPLSFWYPTPNSWFFARGADHAPVRIAINAAGRTVVTAGTGSGGAFEQKLSGQPFFLAGNWDKIDADGISVYLPKGAGASEQARAKELAAFASEAKAYAAGLLGAAPDVPVRLVSVNRGAGFTSGGTILIDDGVFRRGKIDALTAMNIADSVVKIWIGSAAAINDEGQGAVREGLTRYIATQFLESKFGKDVADIERMRQRNAYAAVVRRDSPLSSVSPLDDYYYAAVANKGAMVWRILERRVGRDRFYEAIRGSIKDGSSDLSEIRAAFSEQKELLDKMFDEVTDTNLLVGLPQAAGGETKAALRNTGSTDVTVTVVATTANGEKIPAATSIRANSFGEVSFRTPSKVVRLEIDTEKLYPQTEYSDDVAPREFTDSDLLLAVKRLFDKQDFAGAEKAAHSVLREYPRLDDVRVLLARSQAALGKNTDAEREFRIVLDEKLPTARSIAWASVGLAEIAAKTGRATEALKYADDAIRADADYGASLAARAVRGKLNAGGTVDEGIKAFFAQWDRVAVSNRKADLEAMVVPGEVSKFATGIAGSTEQWQTQVKSADLIGPDAALVETHLNIKLLTKDAESGTAVYRLARVGGGWKLAAVEIFEVR